MFNIKFKGVYKSEEQLNCKEIPENFKKYNEPENISEVFIYGFLISLPAFILIGLFIYSKINFKSMDKSVLIMGLIITWIISFISIIFHEVLHGVCFPLNVKKEIWVKPKELAIFIYCSEPLSKIKFILTCLCPNIILGVFPLIIWGSGVFGFSSLISFVIMASSCMNILAGIGDYYNVYLTIKQVPKNSIVQNFGFHSYWGLK